MPFIIEYARVMEQMRSQGMVCNYPNSGAFGFPRGVPIQVEAWIGPEDPTIRPEMRPFVRLVLPPYEPALAELACRRWQETLGGEAWFMPMSHWAFEVEYGSREWMPELLKSAGVDWQQLSRRTDGSAIAFSPQEQEGFVLLLRGLLAHLSESDFMLAFPGRDLLCTIHHHKQLWWVGRGHSGYVTSDE